MMLLLKTIITFFKKNSWRLILLSFLEIFLIFKTLNNWENSFIYNLVLSISDLKNINFSQIDKPIEIDKFFFKVCQDLNPKSFGFKDLVYKLFNVNNPIKDIQPVLNKDIQPVLNNVNVIFESKFSLFEILMKKCCSPLPCNPPIENDPLPLQAGIQTIGLFSQAEIPSLQNSVSVWNLNDFTRQNNVFSSNIVSPSSSSSSSNIVSSSNIISPSSLSCNMVSSSNIISLSSSSSNIISPSSLSCNMVSSSNIISLSSSSSSSNIVSSSNIISPSSLSCNMVSSSFSSSNIISPSSSFSSSSSNIISPSSSNIISPSSLSCNMVSSSFSSSSFNIDSNSEDYFNYDAHPIKPLSEAEQKADDEFFRRVKYLNSLFSWEWPESDDENYWNIVANNNNGFGWDFEVENIHKFEVEPISLDPTSLNKYILDSNLWKTDNFDPSKFCETKRCVILNELTYYSLENSDFNENIAIRVVVIELFKKITLFDYIDDSISSMSLCKLNSSDKTLAFKELYILKDQNIIEIEKLEKLFFKFLDIKTIVLKSKNLIFF